MERQRTNPKPTYTCNRHAAAPSSATKVPNRIILKIRDNQGVTYFSVLEDGAESNSTISHYTYPTYPLVGSVKTKLISNNQQLNAG